MLKETILARRVLGIMLSSLALSAWVKSPGYFVLLRAIADEETLDVEHEGSR
jgi:hypothetical protein